MAFFVPFVSTRSFVVFLDSSATRTCSFSAAKKTLFNLSHLFCLFLFLLTLLTGTMVAASSRRRKAVSSCAAVAVLAFAAAAIRGAAAAVDPLTAAVAAALPDPSPSLRSVGDTFYTTLKSNATTSVLGGLGNNNGTSAIKSEWMCFFARENEKARKEKSTLSQRQQLKNDSCKQRP